MDQARFYKEILGLTFPFEIDKIELEEVRQEVHVYLSYPSSELLECPECKSKCKTYDVRAERTWRHLDSCEYKTFLHCKMPRVICSEHGVKTIKVPWSAPRSHWTIKFEILVISLLQATKNRSSVGKLLKLSWDEVDRIMQSAVVRGLERRELEDLSYLGIDEKSFLRGQSYVTVLSDTVGRRVLEISPGRDSVAVGKVYDSLSPGQLSGVKAVSMDFWEAFQQVTKIYLPSSDIVHDKFHIMKYANEAVDKVRRKESGEKDKVGDATLKKTKYLFLKNRSNWTAKQKERFASLNIDQLEVGKAWNKKELLIQFWNCADEEEAGEFFNNWYRSAIHMTLKPVVELAEMLQRHIDNILNYFTHRISNSFAEGINSVIQHIKATARGFRSFENYRTSILFYCGKLDLFPRHN